MDYLQEAVVGGIVISSLSYIIKNISNPVLAAIFTGVPLGLIGCFVLTETKQIKAYLQYAIWTSLLSASTYIAVGFFINWFNKEKTIILAFIFWFLASTVLYFASNTLAFMKLWTENKK